MNYRGFRRMVIESFPSIPINDKYISSGMRGAYERIPARREVTETQARVYAQVFADALLAGRNSINARAIKTIRGLVGVINGHNPGQPETEPAIPATRNPARPPIVA